MASKVISTILNLKDNFSKTLEGTTKTAKSFQNQIQHAQNSIGSFSQVMGKVRNVATVFAGGFGIVKFTEGAINAGDSAYKLSQKLHISSTEAAGLNKILSITGTDSAPVISTLTKLDKGLETAGTSGNTTTKALKEYGVSLTDTKGKLLPMNQQLEQLAIAYKKASESGQEEAFSAEVLGTKGQELIPLLENYTEAKNEAAKVKGIGVDPKQAHETAEELKVLKMQVSATAGVMAKSLIPVVQAMLPPIITIFQRITDVIKANKSKIDIMIQTYLPTVKMIISGVMSAVASFVNFSTQHIELVKTVFMSLGTAIIGINIASKVLKIVESINDIKKAVSGLSGLSKVGGIFSKIFGLPPQVLIFIAIIAVVAGVAYLIIKNWTPIKTFFTGIWNSVKSTISNFWNWLKSFMATWGIVILAVIAPFIGVPLLIVQHWSQIKEKLSNVWNSIKIGATVAFNAIKVVVIALWNGIKTAVIAIVTPIVGGVLNIWNSMKGGITTIFAGIKNVIQGVWSIIKNIILGPVLLIVDLVKGNWTKIGSDAKAIFTNFGNAFKQIWNGIKQIFSGSLSAIVGFVKMEWNGIVNIAKAIWNGLGSFLSGLWNGIKALAVVAWEGLKNGVITIVEDVWRGIVIVFTSIVNFFRNLPTTLYNLGVAIFTSLKDGAWSIISSIGAWIAEKFNAAVDFFRNLPDKMLEFGKNFIQGFINGAEGMIDAVINKVKQVGASVEKTIREALGIHSPSRVMHSIGQFVVQGLANGISTSTNLVSNAASKIGKSLPKQFYGWGQDIPGSLSDGITDNIKTTTDTITDMANGIRRLIHFTKPDEGPLKDSDTYGPDMCKGLSEGIQNNMPLTTNATIAMATNIRNVITQLISDSIGYGQQIVNSLGQGVQESIASLTDIVKSLTDKVVTAFREGFGIHSPSKIMHEIGGYLMQGLVNGMTSNDVQGFIQKQIGSIVDAASGSIGGNVSSWLGTALAITGTDAGWLPGLLRLASYESGDPGTLGSGSPTMVNNVSVGGEYATGLLQMLPSTFKEFMQPGMNNITNPIDNAAAAIRYIKDRYGSVYNTPLFRGGSYLGYATGTDDAKSGIADIAEEGMELVIGRQARRFKGGEQVLNNKDTVSLLKNGKDGKAINVYVIIKGNVIGNEEYMEEVGEYVGNKVMSQLNNI